MFDISMSDCKTDWLWMSIGFSGCAEFVFDWMKRGRPVGMGNAGKGSRIPTLESKSIQGWGTRRLLRGYFLVTLFSGRGAQLAVQRGSRARAQLEALAPRPEGLAAGPACAASSTPTRHRPR